jgi:hypothetical protein
VWHQSLTAGPLKCYLGLLDLAAHLTRRDEWRVPQMNLSEPHEKADFSLVLGGPLYQLYLRGKLLRPPIDLVHRRILAFVLVTWLPLAVLTAFAGSFIGGGAQVSFLFDLDAHIRLLVCLPLMIGAELIVHRRIREAVGQFTGRNLILPEDQAQFDAIIAGTMRLRNSIVVEVVLMALAITGGYWLWRSQAALPIATWYAVPADGSVHLTWAGYWYAFVSLAIARFILLRWLFRLFIWYAFLWRVSRMRLRVDPLHPDRAGGLGFLGNTIDAFSPLLFALSAFLAGAIATRIWQQGARLSDFKFEIFGFAVILILIVLLPLTLFAFQMMEAKRVAFREYGELASRYVSEFREKWLHGRQASDEPLLGSSDIQSLADLANSYEVIHKMPPLPFNSRQVLRLAIIVALPLLPLTLTMIPLEEMAQRLIKLLL